MNDVKAVVLAQEYIKSHHTDMEFSVENVCNAVGYSRRQLDRLFQKHMSITLYEYINAVLLSESAAKLVDSDNTVIDVALDYVDTLNEKLSAICIWLFFLSIISYVAVLMVRHTKTVKQKWIKILTYIVSSIMLVAVAFMLFETIREIVSCFT